MSATESPKNGDATPQGAPETEGVVKDVQKIGENEIKDMPTVPPFLLLTIERMVFQLNALLQPPDMKHDSIAPRLGLAGEQLEDALLNLRERVLAKSDADLLPVVDYRVLGIPSLKDNMPPPPPPRRVKRAG